MRLWSARYGRRPGTGGPNRSETDIVRRSERREGQVKHFKFGVERNVLKLTLRCRPLVGPSR